MGISVVLCLHSPFFILHSYAKGSGTTGADFLKIGASGRQAAMGDATVGLADDSNAALTNPAAWGRLRRHEVSFLRTEWLLGTNYTGLVYGHSTERFGNLGASVLWLDMPDLQGYDLGGFSNRTVKAGDRAVVLGYGRSFGGLSLGTNVKWMEERLDHLKASALAGDAGVHWKTPFLSGSQRVDMGLAVRNVGSKIKFINDSGELPASVDMGIGYRAFYDALHVDVDASLPKDGDAEWRTGVEYWIRHLLALRAGYRPTQDIGSKFTIGFGLRVQQISLDYALADFGDLETTHRFSLRFRFGGVVAKTYQKAVELAREEKYVPALGQLEKVLEYEPYNAEALSQVRSLKQIYETSMASPESADPYLKALDLFRARRYLSAMDKFMEALLKYPQKENEIRRYMAVIGAEMRGEERLSPEEWTELQRIMASAPSPKAAASSAKTTDDPRLVTALQYSQRGFHLVAYDAMNKLKRIADEEKTRVRAGESMAELRELMDKRARGQVSATEAERLYAAAFMAYVSGQMDDALRDWSQLLSRDPQNREITAYVQAYQGRTSQTLQVDRLKHLSDSGLYHFQRGEYPLAIEAWQEALQLDPQSEELKRRLEEARQKKKTQDQGAVLRSLHERAKLYYEVGQWDKTIETLNKMKNLRPLDTDAAQLLRNAERQKQLAAEELRRKMEEARRREREKDATEKKPIAPRDESSSMSLYQRGLIAYAQGNLVEAISLWEQALAHNPDNTRVQKALERARLDLKSRLP